MRGKGRTRNIKKEEKEEKKRVEGGEGNGKEMSP